MTFQSATSRVTPHPRAAKPRRDQVAGGKLPRTTVLVSDRPQGPDNPAWHSENLCWYLDDQRERRDVPHELENHGHAHQPLERARDRAVSLDRFDASAEQDRRRRTATTTLPPSPAAHPRAPRPPAAANAADIQHRYATTGRRIALSTIAESSPLAEPPIPPPVPTRRDNNATTADQKSNATISASSRFVRKKSDKQAAQLARKGQRDTTLLDLPWDPPEPTQYPVRFTKQPRRRLNHQPPRRHRSPVSLS